MARTVSPGEPIAPHLTAAWYNSTLQQPPNTPTPRGKEGQHHNEHLATFLPTNECQVVERFTAIAPVGPVDNYYQTLERAQYVSKEAITKHNWFIAQLEMSEVVPTQPVVYAGITWAKVDIRDPSHQYVDIDLDTLELFSSTSGKGLILQKGPVYSLISIEVYTSNTTTTTPAPDHPQENCQGKCKWEVVDGEWQVADSSCGPPSTTTTTTSEPTTTTTPGCRSTSTTTSYDPEAINCECLPPTFCPTDSGDCTFTECSTGSREPLECSTTSSSTTTTCDCNTTSSADPNTPPGCGGYTGVCTWTNAPDGTPLPIASGCGPGCECVGAGNEYHECGVIYATYCVCPPAPDPLVKRCEGEIYWYCVEGRWNRSWYGSCIGHDPDGECNCVPDIPSGPCANCEGLVTYCQFDCPPQEPTTTSNPCGDTPYTPGIEGPCVGCYTSTTSSTTTTGCATTCIMKHTGSYWADTLGECYYPCECSVPAEPPTESCEVVRTPCQSTTTTPPLKYWCASGDPSCEGEKWCFGSILNPPDTGDDYLCGGPWDVYEDCSAACGPTTTTSTTSTTTTTTTTTTTSTSTSTTTTCPCDRDFNTPRQYSCKDGGGWQVCNNAPPTNQICEGGEWLPPSRPCASEGCDQAPAECVPTTTTTTSTTTTAPGDWYCCELISGDPDSGKECRFLPFASSGCYGPYDDEAHCESVCVTETTTTSPVMGACCHGFDNMDCTLMTQADCLAASGIYRGDGVPCESWLCET